MSQEGLLNANHPSQEIANQFQPTQEPLNNVFVQTNPAPTSSRHYQSISNKPDEILKFCKDTYTRSLDQLYELKGIGVLPKKFLLQDDLAMGLKEAENQAMEAWSFLVPETQEGDQWKENKKGLHTFISETNSSVQIKNTSNQTLYVEGVRSKIKGNFSKMLKVKYHSLFSSGATPKTLEKSNVSIEKFYDHENLKRIVKLLVDQVNESCEKFAIKLNPTRVAVKSTDIIFKQLKVEAENLGKNLVNRNYQYMTTIQEHVKTSIISKFESDCKVKIKVVLDEKQPSDLKSTKERIRNIIKGLMDPCLIQVDKIYNEFAVENCQQLLAHWNKVLESQMTELCVDAIEKWREICKELIKSHHDGMKETIPIKSTSTPQFVLDIYAKHLNTALNLAQREVEENIQEEQPSTAVVEVYENRSDQEIEVTSSLKALPPPKPATSTSQNIASRITASSSNRRFSKRGQNGGPSTSTSAAAAGDGVRSSKQHRKS